MIDTLACPPQVSFTPQITYYTSTPELRAEPETLCKQRKKRLRLLWQDPHCCFCRRPLTLNNSTLDHLIPLSKGGKSYGSNLRLCCRGCNLEKGSMKLGKFRRSLEARMREHGLQILLLSRMIESVDRIETEREVN